MEIKNLQEVEVVELEEVELLEELEEEEVEVPHKIVRLQPKVEEGEERKWTLVKMMMKKNYPCLHNNLLLRRREKIPLLK